MDARLLMCAARVARPAEMGDPNIATECVNMRYEMHIIVVTLTFLLSWFVAQIKYFICCHPSQACLMLVLNLPPQLATSMYIQSRSHRVKGWKDSCYLPIAPCQYTFSSFIA